VRPIIQREIVTTLFEAIFWLSATCVFYTYVAYPLILAATARLRPASSIRRLSVPNTPVTVVLAVYNEEAFIGPRVRELARLIACLPAGGEVIVVSDGSTDQTAETAQTAASAAQLETGVVVPIRIAALPTNVGKAAALNAGWAAACHPLLVFADARQTWAPDAIDRITENFADLSVGAVSGDLVVQSPLGAMAGFGLYWRFEKWLRRTESRFYSLVSVSGSICAVRRELFRPIPNGTILDDVYWPLAVAMSGHRVIHDERARAFDRLPVRVREEFWRKVRTLCGNFQLLTRLPSTMLPWRNPLWWQFVSHRILRLLVPWALIGLAASVLVLEGQVYRVVLWVQAALYLLAVAGTNKAIATRCSVASAAATVLVLNTAAWIAFWVWITGRTGRTWGKFAYGIAPPTHEIREVAPSGVKS
jgi:cellulose synthase/poly-beta-1,6-N-acetylglucosamine synthase-like glycosyltransferase